MKLKNLESPIIESYRQILGVKVESSVEDIKKAYRNMAQIYHPDKTDSETAQNYFLKVKEAYEVLLDSEKIELINREFVQEKLFGQCIDGVNITFGSFFGYRKFQIKRTSRNKRIGVEKPTETDESPGFYDLSYADNSKSILDSAAFDSIELVFAGKFSAEDDSKMKSGFKGGQVAQYPWIVMNNRGIMHFLAGEFERAFDVFEELNQRVPNNIIFLYRLSLCHVLMAFKKKKKTLLLGSVPDSKHIKKAIEYLKRGILLGENRPVGRQKCLMLRKTLAEIYESTKQYGKAKKMWEEILDIQPKSKEAQYKLGEGSASKRIQSSRKA